MSLIFVGNNVNTSTIGVIAGMLVLLCTLTVVVLISCLAIIITKCSRSTHSSFHTGQLAMELGPIYEDIQPSVHMKNECTVSDKEVNKSFIALNNNDAYTI